MTLMDRRRALLPVKEAELPASYQKVSYIGYDTSGAYLVTPITNSQITTVVADIEKYSLPATNNGSVFPSCYVASSQSVSTIYFGTLENADGSSFTADPYFNKTDTFSRATIISTKNNPAPELYVSLGYRGGSWCPGLRFYMLRVFNGTSLLFDGIPCYRKSDTKIGMYDLVSNSFIECSGTWLKGADVV